MVAAEPYLREVAELVVVRNHLRHEVAVVVDDRHLLCASVIQLASIVVCEHEVIMNERFVIHESVEFGKNVHVCRFYLFLLVANIAFMRLESYDFSSKEYEKSSFGDKYTNFSVNVHGNFIYLSQKV